MIAKPIVKAPTRGAAAAALANVVSRVEVWPVKTNAAFLARAANDVNFVAGHVDTGFIERHAERLLPPAEPSAGVLQAAAHAFLAGEFDMSDPWRALQGFRANTAADRRIAVEVGGGCHVVEVEDSKIANCVAEVCGERVLFVDGEAWAFSAPTAGARPW